MTPVCPPPASDCPAVFLLTCREHGARGVRLYRTNRGWSIFSEFAIRFTQAERDARDLSLLTVLDPAWVALDDLCREQTNQVDYDGSCLRCGAAAGERGRCPC
jgi:hypothetical protein